MTLEADAIGGYFSLELPRGKGELYPQARRYQSARAGFLALLESVQPSAVWMPRYICDGMLEPLKQRAIPCKHYALGEGLEIPDDINLGERELLVCVNYFGVCERQIQNALRHLPAAKVVVDNAQAMFFDPIECLATLYSPRKFVGVPDGGYLVTSTGDIPDPGVSSDSLGRANHLLQRIALGAEGGYAAYKGAEASLAVQRPMRMSRLTQRMLETVDYEAVQVARKENFEFLHRKLGPMNRFPLPHTIPRAPLCYPFWPSTQAPRLRAQLIERRIYVANYWPEVLGRIPESEFDGALARELIPLPIDQRYGRVQMELIAQCVFNCLEKQP